MPFLFTTLKIFLVIFFASHIAIAGPLPDLFSSEGAQVSGGSVFGPNRAAGGDSLLSGLDLLELLSGNGGHAGEVEVDSEKPASHIKGVGGSSLAGTRHRQGNTVSQPAGAVSESAQGGSVSGGEGVLNILAGNGGEGGRISRGGPGLLRKKNL